MKITVTLLDEIEQQAKQSPRLRANLCLHKSQTDKVQKMVNVLLPGTQMPTHRHLNSDETLTILRGTATIVYYDDLGVETDRITISQNVIPAIDIPKGQWHNIIVVEPVCLLEIKEGPYVPLREEEIMQK